MRCPLETLSESPSGTCELPPVPGSGETPDIFEDPARALTPPCFQKPPPYTAQNVTHLDPCCRGSCQRDRKARAWRSGTSCVGYLRSPFMLLPRTWERTDHIFPISHPSLCEKRDKVLLPAAWKWATVAVLQKNSFLQSTEMEISLSLASYPPLGNSTVPRWSSGL